MAPITLEQFKTGWELGLEVAGAGVGAAALVWRNAGLIRSAYEVVMGTATRREEQVVAEALRDAGPNADAMISRIADNMAQHGHQGAADRVRAIESQVQAAVV